MPTYAYACTECEHRFEIVQSFSDDSLTVCPECDGRLRKLFNAVGVVFKGSGFYKTDSGSSSKPKKASSGSEGSGSSTSGSSSSSGSSNAGTTSGSSSSSSSSSSSGTSSSAPAAASAS